MSGFMGGGLRGEDLGEVSVVTTAVAAEVSSKGPFIYYVSTFLYQPQHFHKFFENFLLYQLKISNYSMKILSKCNVEK